MPRRGEPHLALAMLSFQGGDLPAAVRSLCDALALAPELADAHELLGRILIETGPWRKGVAHLLYGEALDPALRRLRIDHGRICALRGDYETAHALLINTEADVRTVIPWFTRLRLCMWQRDAQRAQRYLPELEPQRTAYPRPWRFLRFILAPGPIDPREIMTEGLGSDHSSPRGRAFFYQIHSEVYSFLGQRELAVRSLSRAVDAGLADLMWFDRCPLILEIARDPRVAALRRVVWDRAQAVRAVAAAAPPIEEA
jgi:tetratricopeptide (TPR) repeat protein